MYLISVDPPTRINDQWLAADIDCSPAKTIYRHPMIGGAPNATPHRADFYKKIALDIVSETVFDYPYPYITEKTLRPIACKRMFIIIGAAGTLAVLKDHGIQTWADLIDESYDEMSNAKERFLAVTDSIRNFCQIPLDTVKTFMNVNQDRFENNFKVLQTLPHRDLSRIMTQLQAST